MNSKRKLSIENEINTILAEHGVYIYEWINVDQQLPEENEIVFIMLCREEDDVIRYVRTQGYYSNEDGWIYSYKYIEEGYELIEWTRFPPLPHEYEE